MTKIEKLREYEEILNSKVEKLNNYYENLPGYDIAIMNNGEFTQKEVMLIRSILRWGIHLKNFAEECGVKNIFNLLDEEVKRTIVFCEMMYNLWGRKFDEMMEGKLFKEYKEKYARENNKKFYNNKFYISGNVAIES